VAVSRPRPARLALVRRLAAAAPVPVFVARGLGAGRADAELAADRRLHLVGSPRQATVLLATGRFPGRLGDALARVHDQLPHPRTALWWRRPGWAEVPPALAGAAAVAELAALPAALVAAHRALVAGGPSAPDVGPDQPPQPFEGRGDHGQGGEGMMGGVPWGRPMAMPGEDRDGLALDELSLDLGPFQPGFPPGLVAHLRLQGEVVVEAGVERAGGVDGGPAVDPVTERLGEPGSPGGRARAEARAELRRVADLCRLGGLGPLAARAAAVAADPGARAVDAARLAAAVRRSRLPARWAGVGRVGGIGAGDRLALALARAEGALARADGGAGTLPPAPATVDPDELAGALAGLDWGDAVVTLASVPDPSEAPRPAAAAASRAP